MKRVVISPRYRSVAVGVGLILVLGLLLGSPPEPGPSGFDDSAAPGLASVADQEQRRQRAQAALAWLRTHGVFSVAQPESQPKQTDAQSATDAAPPPPEGLDRFELVGVIRVGEQPRASLEALLVDMAEGSAVFRARKGETLKDTAVELVSLQETRAQLRLEERERTLVLFPRPELSGPDIEPSNEE